MIVGTSHRQVKKWFHRRQAQGQAAYSLVSVACKLPSSVGITPFSPLSPMYLPSVNPPWRVCQLSGQRALFEQTKKGAVGAHLQLFQSSQFADFRRNVASDAGQRPYDQCV